MNRNQSIFLLILLLIAGPVTSLHAEDAPLNGVLEVLDASARESRQLAIDAYNRTLRLSVWAAEPNSPQKSMRVGMLEAQIRDDLALIEELSDEIIAAAIGITQIEPRLNTNGIVAIGENMEATQEALAIHLTAMVSAVNSEHPKQARAMEIAMQTDFTTVKLLSKSVLLHGVRIRRTVLH